MINWLSSLPGVVLGYTKLEQMMIDFNGSVEPLLAYEEFTVQLKTGNPKVLEFVKREAVTLIRYRRQRMLIINLFLGNS
jgi:hypothetical protein